MVYITLSFASFFFFNFPEGSETINNFILSFSLLRSQRQINNNLTNLHENTLTNFFLKKDEIIWLLEKGGHGFISGFISDEKRPQILEKSSAPKFKKQIKLGETQKL